MNERSLKAFKWYKYLATTKGRREAGAFLVEGDRAIKQIMENFPGEIIEIVTKKELSPVYSFYPTRRVNDSQFRSISCTRTPQGPIAVVRIPCDIYSDMLPGNIGERVLLLEDIQDPGNVGTLIRSAAAFGYDGVILSDKCADPLSPKSVQASAGSILSLWLRRNACYLELAYKLKGEGYSLVVASLEGIGDPSLLNNEDKLVLGLGNEVSGPSLTLMGMAKHTIKIEIAREKAESLNVAVCGAICIYLTSVDISSSRARTHTTENHHNEIIA
jgi:TrmH family RNA methyltransferase